MRDGRKERKKKQTEDLEEEHVANFSAGRLSRGTLFNTSEIEQERWKRACNDNEQSTQCSSQTQPPGDDVAPKWHKG